MPAHKAEQGQGAENQKKVIVEISWIRPTKICAIFDLFLGILCYIIALVSGEWVIERWQYEDEEHDQDIKRYWVGLWEQCYRAKRAKELLKFGCGQISTDGNDGSQISQDCSRELTRLTELTRKDENVEECRGLNDPLPWAHGTTFGTSHFLVTKFIVIICLVVALLCFVVALFIYCKNNKYSNLTHVYKLIGCALFVVFALNLSAVIYFGIGFTNNAPYSSVDWYFWTGYGFCFAACVLMLLASILFFFGAKWKKTGYTHRRTVNI